MKRVLRMLVLLCSLFGFATIVHASTAGDSVSLTEQELADYQIHEGQILLKVYHDDFADSFIKGKDIYDIVGEAKVSYYLVEGALTGQKLILGEDGTVINRGADSNTWQKLRKYVLNPHLVFPKWVEVKEVYIFSEYDDFHGAAIYYVTSIGDFVLNQSYGDTTTYLYSIGAFVRCSKEFEQFLVEYGSGFGIPVMRDACNIGLYQFTGTTTAFRIPIIISITILMTAGWALAVLFFLKWRKTKKQSAPTPEPDTPAA